MRGLKRIRKCLWGTLLIIPIIVFLLTGLIYASQWAIEYEGVHYQRDTGSSIQQTTDGGYIVAGTIQYFSTDSDDMWILKLNPDGTITWQKAYGSVYHDEVSSIQQTADGGYVVLGDAVFFGSYDFWVLKLNSDGATAWQKTYGSSKTEYASSIQQTSDGGYIVAGNTTSFGTGSPEVNDVWILKLDTNGNIQWQKTYGGSGYDSVVGDSIQQTTDGGYIVAGQTDSFSAGDDDVWIMKLNASGTVQWQKTYDSNSGVGARAIRQTSDGGYIVAGLANSSSYEDILLLKLTTDGNVSWQKTYDNGGRNYVSFIQETSDNGYVLVGWNECPEYSDSADLLIMKLDANGEIPGCNIMRSFDAVVTDTSAITTNTSAVPQQSSVVSSDTNVFPQDTAAVRNVICDNSLPTIGLSPTNFSFTATQGGSNPSNQSLSISNTGGGTLNWLVSDNATWLSLSPTSGTNSGTVTLSVNITGLTAGTYNATITITATGATNSPVSIPAALTVNAPPTIGYSPTSFSFTATQGGLNPPAQSLSISNTDGGTLNWSVSDNANWLSLSPTSGTNSGTVTLSVNITGLTAGTYNATITITATGATNSPVSIPVTLMVNAPPTIGYSPTSFSFTATQGGSNPSSQSLSITNTGGGTLNWTVSNNANWLSLSPISGTNSGTVTISVNSGGVTVGSDVSDGFFTIQP